ncbi:homoserine kinase [Alicyclobacillus dauci]|uniref:Homoserine kinase n=1 Tax=Alicyclobacillus dauci TaxID=1475485 RepID=A0ABY6Z059_9BACL|nr:homoserine kinase [Alicyclobacillus dauci]WAH35751.1 homoserine kinase [Alicyclobacillus dauci]
MTMPSSIVVRVPATSANLGPGFDCLGLALDLYNTFRLVLGQPFSMEVTGESAERLPRGENNVVVKAMRRVFLEADVDDARLPTFSLHLENQVPVSSGLGSSASAIVGGLVLGNAVVELVAPDRMLSRDDILKIATEIEGHPDNVAPALFGGGILAYHTNAGLRTTSFPVPNGLRFVAATPDFALSTEAARKVLPSTYDRSLVIENVAQSARLMLALATNDLNLLRGGLIDNLHEPYRMPLVPSAEEVALAATAAGALTVTLSGAGPTMLAWCKPEQAVTVADEMTLAWRNAGTPCRALVLQPCLCPTQALYIS